MHRLGWGLAVALGIFVVATVMGVVNAGPLDPPSGVPTTESTQEGLIYQPVDCTGFPISISAPGSYKLAQNITMLPACGADNGITVTPGLDGVTIDLAGFTLAGIAGSGLHGVQATGGANVTVLNGTVRDWDGHGLLVTSEDSLIQRVHAHDNGLNGIGVGAHAVVSDVTASRNTFEGITVGTSSVVRDCSANNNGNNGIILADTGRLENCTANANAGSGISVSSFGGSLSACSALGNVQHGINVFGAGATISTCSASDNTLDGIHVTGDTVTITGCSMYSNGSDGIEVSNSNGTTISDCTATDNGGDGFNLFSTGTTISGCTATDNGDDGIALSQKFSLVTNCTATLNGNDGIQVVGSAQVIGNSANLNGATSVGAGIHVVLEDNHIEGNLVDENDKGIDVDGSFNTIIANHAGFNPTADYEIAASNITGTIVTTEAAMNGATNSNVNINQ
jgi:parallel beta-helix repeat protein